jgi:hypothetical protein
MKLNEAFELLQASDEAGEDGVLLDNVCEVARYSLVLWSYAADAIGRMRRDELRSEERVGAVYEILEKTIALYFSDLRHTLYPGETDLYRAAIEAIESLPRSEVTAEPAAAPPTSRVTDAFERLMSQTPEGKRDALLSREMLLMHAVQLCGVTVGELMADGTISRELPTDRVRDMFRMLARASLVVGYGAEGDFESLTDLRDAVMAEARSIIGTERTPN